MTEMKKVNTTAYHPQTDGLVENFNRTLRSMLQCFAIKLVGTLKVLASSTVLPA